jgi:serine/threonine protein kinase
MEARPAAHPSAEILLALASGKLDDAGASAVIAHLDDCSSCCQKAASLSGDSFLERLRAAHGRSGTPVPSKPLFGIAAAVSPTPAVLPELRDHPDYEVLRELGRGGMGVVYLAKNRRMDRLEVLKVVNRQLLDHPGAVERFLREIRSAARLSHRNIVMAYAAPQIGDLLVFAMEYIEGEDLARVVKARGPLPVANACYYVQQAALGLQHAFEKGMVHRDIKPQNLILARDGKKHVVKVLDFGLAKATREKEGTGHDLTGTGKMLGTPDYIAPEQTLDAAKADIRADVYSLGCTLYFLLTGRPPFEANNLYALLHAHQSMQARPLNEVREDVPAELAAVAARMLAKDPAERYQKPMEVVQALAPFVKPGAKPDAKADSAPARGVASPGKGRIATDASQIKKVVRDVLGQAPPKEMPAKEEASPFADLVETSAPPRNAKGLLGAKAIGVALVMALVMLGWIIVAVKTPDGAVIVVVVDQPGAVVLVDGGKIKVTIPEDKKPVKIKAEPGRHRLRVSKEGFEVATLEVELKIGGSEPINIQLKPIEPVILAKEPGQRYQKPIEVVQPGVPPSGPPEPIPPDGEGQPRPIDKAAIDAAVEKGVKYLKDLQQQQGTWQHNEIGLQSGLTALCGLTLLECGVPADDAAVRKAAAAVRAAAVDAEHTYSLALSILFLDRLGEPVDVALIKLLSRRLLAGQIVEGGWSYFCRKNAARPGVDNVGDNSNTQFAVLGLWAARRYGLRVDGALQKCEKHFRRTQNADGGWSYNKAFDRNPSTPSMTSAGLLGVALACGAGNEAALQARPNGQDPGNPGPPVGHKVQDPNKDKDVVAAFDWLGVWIEKSAVPAGKVPKIARFGVNFYYFLWGLERIAVAYDKDQFGKTDWYSWGAEILLAYQGPNGGWTNGGYPGPPDTCFALLFLRRANLTRDLTRLLKGHRDGAR